ncbi:MAG: hypothetical protein H7Y04_13440 [Verrucomicrobia bacterium]|nr:hypothetical protein [Cytophagales bacterium]
MSHKKSFLFACWCFLSVSIIAAQSVNNSPYSQFGLGNIQPQTFIPQSSMGGLGVSYANGISINNVNPALLSRNTRFTVFDLGIVMQGQETKTATQAQQSFGGTLQYLSLAFPVTANKPDTAFLKWTTGLSLMPYTTVNYETRTTQALTGSLTDVYTTNYKGTGGLTRIDFTNGFQLGKNLSLGLKTSYIFGDITKQVSSAPRLPSIVVVTNPQTGAIVGVFPNSLTTSGINRINHSDFVFKLGAAYRYPFSKKLFLNAGVTHEFATKLKSQLFQSIQNSGPTGGVFITDTLASEAKGFVKLPSQTQFGLSIEETYHWMIGADFTILKAKDFRNFDGQPSYQETSYQFTVGSEWTPNFSSISNYFSRVTYRVGFNHSLLPLCFNGKQLQETGLSTGASFPVGRGLTLLNVGATVGKRGTTSNNLVEERYIRMYLGISINDRWFIPRKID